MTSLFKHILIADDDQDDIELFQDAVNEICPDLKLTIATDSEKLINLLSKIPKPGAIVLDLNMPLKSGKGCLKEIRNNYEFKDVSVVILESISLVIL